MSKIIIYYWLNNVTLLCCYLIIMQTRAAYQMRKVLHMQWTINFVRDKQLEPDHRLIQLAYYTIIPKFYQCMRPRVPRANAYGP